MMTYNRVYLVLFDGGHGMCLRFHGWISFAAAIYVTLNCHGWI